MNQSYLRDRLVKIVDANRPMIDGLINIMTNNLPPMIKLGVGALLPMIPANLTDITIAKIRSLPDAELEKFWGYVSSIYNYCGQDAPVGRTLEQGTSPQGTSPQDAEVEQDVTTGEDIPTTGPKGDDIRGDGERQNGVCNLDAGEDSRSDTD